MVYITAETIPRLEGCDVRYVMMGEEVACAVNFDTDDNVNVVFEANNANASFVPETKTVVFTQISDDPVNIQ